MVDRAGFSACGVWAITADANIKVNTVAATLLIRLQFLAPTFKKRPQRSGPVVVFPRSRTRGVELQGSPLAFERLSRRSVLEPALLRDRQTTLPRGGERGRLLRRRAGQS